MSRLFKKLGSKAKTVSLLLLCAIVWRSGGIVPPLQARYATAQEAPIVFHSCTFDITVQKDGQADEIFSYEAEIKNEKGRQILGQILYTFTKDTTRVTILEASCERNGQTFSVSPKDIETKPLASDPSGFDDIMQILLALPDVSVGSRVKLKVQYTTIKPLIPDFYANHLQAFPSGLTKNAYIRVVSHLPLFLHVNDPWDKLIVENSHPNPKTPLSSPQKISIRLKPGKTIYPKLENEESCKLPREKTTSVSLSSMNRIEDMTLALTPGFETVLSQPLPLLYQSIGEKVKSLSDFHERLDTLTSQLANQIRYMGDWRTLKGRIQPRPMQEVADKKMGDCKDFATATVALLRTLGYQAHIVLVMREERYRFSDTPLPLPDRFNHAMVYVKGPEGQPHWIDPTNFVSFSRGIFQDVAHRPVLVLDEKNPRQEWIPEISPHENAAHIQTVLTVHPEGRLHTECTMIDKGNAAIFLTGKGLFSSSSQIQEKLIEALSGEKNPLQAHVDLPPALYSRIVPSEMIVKASFDQDHKLLMTNVGQGLSLKMHPLLWAILDVPSDCEGEFFLGVPGTIQKTLFLKDQNVPQVTRLEAEILTPWIDITRRCYQRESGVEIVTTVTVKQRFILSQELQSPLFKKLQKDIKRLYQNAAVIFQDPLPH